MAPKNDRLIISIINNRLCNRKLILIEILISLFSLIVRHINASDCLPFQQIDSNDLTVNEISVRGPQTANICAKARFALAFKIEEKQLSASQPMTNSTSNLLIGYVKVGNVVSHENNCPAHYDGYNNTSNNTKSFLMKVQFECGKFDFVFEKDDSRYWLSSISGIVRFGPKDDLSQGIFINKKLFITSTLKDHFYCLDKIEVDTHNLNESAKMHIQADFWKSEFEVFRENSEDQFFLPKDKNSIPIENGPVCSTET